MNTIESLEARRLMSAGELDLTFGTGGIAALSEQTFDGATEVLPDGTILVVNHLHIRKLLADGSADTSFGGGDGVADLPDVGSVDEVIDVHRSANGKVLVARRTTVMRLNADGSLDMSFGGPAHGQAGSVPGVATLRFGEEAIFSQIGAMAVAADGRIALVGNISDEGVAAVLTPDGAFDSNFGRVVWGPVESDQTVERTVRGSAAAFLADGTLILGGADVAIRRAGFEVIRHGVLFAYDASGAERWFSSGVYANARTVEDIAVRADGSLLVSGVRAGGQDDDGVVLAVIAGGAIDTTFGDNGAMIIDYPNAPADVRQVNHVFVNGASHIQLLSDGRFYVLGQQFERASPSSLRNHLYLSRHLPEGQFDPGFPGLVPIDDADADFVLSQRDLAVAGDGDEPIVLVVRRDSSPATRTYDLHEFDADGPRLTRNGTLLLGGTSENDEISVTRRFRDGRILAVVNDEARVYLPQLVKRIQVYGYGGDDALTIGPNVRSAYLHGGDGDDTLTGGDGNDYLYGAVGNDSLTGGLGHDTLEGNAGKDYLLGSAGNDVIFGHGGRDTLLGTLGNDQLFGGPDSADHVYGGDGEDSAANDPLDLFADVEHLLQ